MIQQNTTINWSEADFVINRFRFPCITEACLLLCIIRPHFTWLRRDQIQEAWEAMRIDMGKAWPCPYWVSLGLRSHIPKNLIGQQNDVSFSCLKCQGEDQSSHFGIWWNLFRGSTEPLQAQDWKCHGNPTLQWFWIAKQTVLSGLKGPYSRGQPRNRANLLAYYVHQETTVRSWSIDGWL